MQHVPPGDLCGFAGIATLMPLLELRRTPATRTRLQKFSSEALGLVGLCGPAGQNYWSDPRELRARLGPRLRSSRFGSGSCNPDTAADLAASTLRGPGQNS